MHLPNFGSILKTPYNTLKSLLQSSENLCEILGTQHSPHLWPRNFQRRWRHERGAKNLVVRGRRRQQVTTLGRNRKTWTSWRTSGMPLGIMFRQSVSLVEQMGFQHKWLVIFIRVFNYLIYSYLVGRANLLIKLSNACMERQTNATLNDRLLSAFEDLNVPVWLLIGSGISNISRRQRNKKMILQRVTQICDTTSLHQKTILGTSSALSAITEVILLSM